MPILKVRNGGTWNKVSGNSFVTIDTTLTQEGQAADAAAVGNEINAKVSLPKTSDGSIDSGIAGQFAISNGEGGITWKTLVNAEEAMY